MFLSRHHRGPKLGATEIARIVRCSVKTVKNWLECYDTTGDVEVQPRCGRPRKTTEKDDKWLAKRARADHEVTAGGLAEEMKGRGVAVSSRTVRRRLRESGLEYTAPLLKPLLSEVQQSKRLEWATAHLDMDWSQVVFTDETTIVLNRPPSRVWQQRGARKPVWTTKHPLKLHLWGCFSAQGFGDIFMFTRNLTADLMCTIYESALLPSSEQWFGDEEMGWVLQEDNDPKHTARLAKKWKEEHLVERMPWPAQSPDLNPIENVWKVLKAEIRRYKPRTLLGLKRAVSAVWRQLSDEYARNLTFSMPHRLEACIASKGGFTPY